MSESQVIDLDYASFDGEVYGSEKPVLVEFWSEKHYSCREVDGILDALSIEFSGKIVAARVDMDAAWQTAEAFGVKRAPTVLLFQNDRVVERMDGPKTRSEYRESLCQLVAPYWVI